MFRPLKNYLLQVGGGILVEQVFYFSLSEIGHCAETLYLSLTLSLSHCLLR